MAFANMPDPGAAGSRVDPGACKDRPDRPACTWFRCPESTSGNWRRKGPAETALSSMIQFNGASLTPRPPCATRPIASDYPTRAAQPSPGTNEAARSMKKARKRVPPG
jgi:hypothetical protein